MYQFWSAIFFILSAIFHIINTDRAEHMIQSTAVRGRFTCGEKPAVGVRIKLFELDLDLPNYSYNYPTTNGGYMLAINHDDVLNETYTNQNGHFFVSGTTVEVGQIQPILKVYHNCLLNGKLGLRKIHFLIPHHFTNYGIYAKRVLDLGIFNLEAILPEMMFRLLLIFMVLVNCQVLEGRKQSVQIRGNFRCGEKIPHYATIELWDENNPLLNFVHQFLVQKKSSDPDDKLSTTHPNINGTFEINATHEEFTKLSPYVVVYHQCDYSLNYKFDLSKDGKFERWRRFVFRIPEQYINDGNEATQIFDLGTWNLQFKFMEEELVTSCGDIYFQQCPSIFPSYSPYLQLLWKNSLGQMNVIISFVLLALISNTNGFLKRNQSFEIHGQFMCGEQPLHRAAIELWNDGRSLLKSVAYILMQKRGPEDSYIGRTNTDECGKFIINTTYQSTNEVNPYIYVYHRCDADELHISKSRPMFKLWRTFAIKIPRKYVNTGNRASRIFNLGVYNLQFQFADEILLENCNMRNELYYRRCAYSMPSPFLSRFTHYDFFIH